MKTGAISGPGIRIPPPVFYVAGLAIGLGLDYLWPTPFLSKFVRYAIGSALVLVSVLIIVPVLVRFRRTRTPFDVRKAASALITDGPYRFSRNPSYVSLTLLYLGIGIVLNNVWIIALAVAVVLVIDLWVVRREEQHLAAKYGQQYQRYKAAVRRWL